MKIKEPASFRGLHFRQVNLYSDIRHFGNIHVCLMSKASPLLYLEWKVDPGVMGKLYFVTLQKK